MSSSMNSSVMIFKRIGKSVAVTQEDLSNCYYITLIFPDLHLLRQQLRIWIYIVYPHPHMVSLTLYLAVTISYVKFHEKILNFENNLLATTLTYLTKFSYVPFSNIFLLLPFSENCAVSRLRNNSLLTVNISWSLGQKIYVNIRNA